MPLRSFEVIPVCFSISKAALILPMLRQVVAHIQMYDAGEITRLRTHPNVGRAGFDAGEHHPRHLEAFRTALRKLESVQARRRTVKLDAFELAACAFCLARARRWILLARRTVMETRTLGNKIFEQLRADWGHLSRIDRGRLLRALVDVGWKKRGLAHELRCSESLVRQLIDSAKMQEHSTGIGRKEAVKMAVQDAKPSGNRHWSLRQISVPGYCKSG